MPLNDNGSLGDLKKADNPESDIKEKDHSQPQVKISNVKSSNEKSNHEFKESVQIAPNSYYENSFSENNNNKPQEITNYVDGKERSGKKAFLVLRK